MPAVAAASIRVRWAPPPDFKSTDKAKSAVAVSSTSGSEPAASLQLHPPGGVLVSGSNSLRWQPNSQSRQPRAPTSPLADARALIESAVFHTERLVSIDHDASPRTVSKRKPKPRRATGWLTRPVEARPITRKLVHGTASKKPPLGGCMRPSMARLRPTLKCRVSKASGLRGRRWKNRACPMPTRTESM